MVIQLLAIPVSYSLAFQAHRIGYGGPILVAALAVLYLLFTPPARGPRWTANRRAVAV